MAGELIATDDATGQLAATGLVGMDGANFRIRVYLLDGSTPPVTGTHPDRATAVAAATTYATSQGWTVTDQGGLADFDTVDGVAFDLATLITDLQGTTENNFREIMARALYDLHTVGRVTFDYTIYL